MLESGRVSFPVQNFDPNSRILLAPSGLFVIVDAAKS